MAATQLTEFVVKVVGAALLIDGGIHVLDSKRPDTERIVETALGIGIILL